MSCAKSVLPAYMAVSTGKPARLPCHSVQVDTAHLPPQTQSISRSPRHDPSVNRTAEISNDVILCPIGLVPRHRESPQVVANQGESDPARPVNQFQVRLYEATRLGGIAELAFDTNEIAALTQASVAAMSDTLAGNAQRIANLENLFGRSVEVLRQISDRLAGLKAGQQRIEQTQEFDGTMLAELLALAKAGGAIQRAAEQGISEKAVRAIVERLGGEGIEREDLVPWLDNWIAAAARELGRRTDEDDAFELARQEAERRFRTGIKNPSSALMDEFVREEREELKRQEERKRRRVRILEEAIRFDELTLDVGAAIEKLRLIAHLAERSEPEDIAAYLFERAGKFYERG